MSQSLETLVGSMTIDSLAAAAGMEVSDVFGMVLGMVLGNGEAVDNDAKPAKVSKPDKPDKPPSDSTSHNTRTAAGREHLDDMILDCLRSQEEPVRALDIRQAVGGTAAQIRTRLNVLIEKNKVSYKGKASGTRYKAKGRRK